jgi:hypothetical protein
MMNNPLEVLRRAFSTLTEEQKGNIRHHLQIGTKILCGGYSSLYVVKGGG